MKDPRNEFKYKSLIVEIQIYENGENLDTMSTKSIPIIRAIFNTFFCVFNILFI